VGSRIPVGSDDGDRDGPGEARYETTTTEPRPTLAEGRYLLDERLGGGGTADVYRGADTRLNRPVAVKLFRPGAGTSAENRFREEAQLLGPLEHPCLVTVYDAGVEDGRAYVVLQLIDGVTLGSRLMQGPLSPKQVVEVGARLADVLAYVHSKGIVHRDVKPSNVLVDETNVYLADFGISRLLGAKHNTASGLAVGTAAYMAPEQVRGLRVGPAADVYSLGLLLLECLTGRVEYPGSTVEAAIARLSRRPRISAGLPAPLRHVLCAMTETDPERRPSAARCANALGKARLVLATEASTPRPRHAPTAPPPGPARKPSPRRGRHAAAEPVASLTAPAPISTPDPVDVPEIVPTHAEGNVQAAEADQSSSARAARLAERTLGPREAVAPVEDPKPEPPPEDPPSAHLTGGERTASSGAPPSRRHRFVRGRRRASSDCRLTSRIGVRSRIVLGVAVALVAVFIGSLVATPTRPTAASRPGGAAPVVPEAPEPDAKPPVPQPPVALPIPSDEPASPTPTPSRKVDKVPPAAPPVNPTPSTGNGGYPLPTPSAGGGELDDDLDGIGDDDQVSDDDGDSNGKPTKKRVVLAKLNFFAWFIALLTHGD
jgi:serine/threonine protein kinase